MKHMPGDCPWVFHVARRQPLILFSSNFRANAFYLVMTATKQLDLVTSFGDVAVKKDSFNRERRGTRRVKDYYGCLYPYNGHEGKSSHGGGFTVKHDIEIIISLSLELGAWGLERWPSNGWIIG